MLLMVSCEENPCCDKPFDIVLIMDDINMNEEWAIKDDQPLMEKLQALGHMVGRKSFMDLEFDWSLTKVVVLKSAEQCFDSNKEQWLAFLEGLKGKTPIIPSHEMINWIENKASYMSDLKDAGINIPEFVLVKGHKEGEAASESNVTLRQIKEEHGWETLVFKPNNSNKGRWCEKVTKGIFDEKDNQFQYVISVGHDMLVQEFHSSISEHGEVSIVMIGDNVSHAVLKRPAPGGFLVHEHWGGITKLHVPTQEEITFARKVVRVSGERFGHFPSFSRVDLIRDNSNELALMEFTPVCPMIYINGNPNVAEALAAHLHNELQNVCSCEDSGRSGLGVPLDQYSCDRTVETSMP